MVNAPVANVLLKEKVIEKKRGWGWSWSFKAVSALLLLVALYAGSAFLLVLLPANLAKPEGASVVEAYVVSNGAHTDVVLPIRSQLIDWSTYFPTTNAQKVATNAEFIAMGWGNKEFYLHVREWSNLTAARAASALLGLDESLLHVTYLSRAELGTRYKIGLTAAQYQALITYILDTRSFKDGQAVTVAGHFEDGDAFYAATGRYTALKTCNTWLGDGLRRSGVPMSYWTPLEPFVLWHLPKVTDQ